MAISSQCSLSGTKTMIVFIRVCQDTLQLLTSGSRIGLTQLSMCYLKHSLSVRGHHQIVLLSLLMYLVTCSLRLPLYFFASLIYCQRPDSILMNTILCLVLINFNE